MAHLYYILSFFFVKFLIGFGAGVVMRIFLSIIFRGLTFSGLMRSGAVCGLAYVIGTFIAVYTLP